MSEKPQIGPTTAPRFPARSATHHRLLKPPKISLARDWKSNFILEFHLSWRISASDHHRSSGNSYDNTGSLSDVNWRHVKFIEEYDPSLPPVHGDRDLLLQVFLNLVKNAAESIGEPSDPS